MTTRLDTLPACVVVPTLFTKDRGTFGFMGLGTGVPPFRLGRRGDTVAGCVAKLAGEVTAWKNIIANREGIPTAVDHDDRHGGLAPVSHGRRGEAHPLED